MIKPVDNSSNVISVKKRKLSSNNDKQVEQTQRSRTKDSVHFSDEAFSALQLDKLVEQIKSLPDIRVNEVTQAQERLQQEDYFDEAAEVLASDFASSLAATI